MTIEKLNGSVQITSPAPRDVWQEILRSDPNSLIFQTPAWTDAICSTGGYLDASRLYETEDHHRWLLPLVRRNNSLLVRQASFPGGWGLGGLIADQPLRPDAVRQVMTDLERQPVAQSVVDPNPLLAPIWEAGKILAIQTVPRLWHVLDLEGGFDEVWLKRFHSTKRTAVRKAEHANLTVAWDSTGKWIQVYYDMYMQWAARRGRQRHLPPAVARWSNRRQDPIRRLQQIAAMLGDSCRFYVAWLGQQAVAAAIMLFDPNNAIFYRGTSLLELANPVRANDLLQRVMIEDACQAGCRYYFMGDSGGVESLMRFKSAFGAAATPFASYGVERIPLSPTKRWVDRMAKGLEARLMGHAD